MNTPKRNLELPAKSRSIGTVSQKKLVLGDKPTLVLETIYGARAALRCTEIEVLELIDDGSLPWAWNIALAPARSDRELRILPACVEHYAKTGGSRPFPNFSLPQIVRQVLPHEKPFLLSPEIRLLLNCSTELVTALTDAGIFRQLPDTKYRPGRNGAACITRESFLSFLKSRLEGAC